MHERIAKDRVALRNVVRSHGTLVQLLVIRDTIRELVQMGFQMDELLRELDPRTTTAGPLERGQRSDGRDGSVPPLSGAGPAPSIPTEPRAGIAAPATETRRPAAAVPHLRVIAGGGRQPSADNWADVPGTWRSDA